jgi:predicted ribosomally synthesized peptide with SipW-like signal peptide
MVDVLDDPRQNTGWWRNRKTRAILAGGLVLGIGAAVTLAAWNDSEFAQGTFTAGTFNLTGSTDGSTFTDHVTAATPASLGFTVSPTALSPGDTVYAPFAVRLDQTTTSNAVVTVSNAATSGSVADLTYSLIQPTAFGCSATTTGTVLVPSATGLGAVPGGTTFTLAHGTAGAAGGAAYLCFTVTAGSNLTQGQTGTATWQFTASSQ